MINEQLVTKKIQELLEKLQNFEDTDPAYYNEDLKELRHKIMYVHMRMESTLEGLISLYVIEPLNLAKKTRDTLQAIRRAGVRNNLTELFNEMDFFKKVKITYKNKIISKKLNGLLGKVNDYRIWFSHPHTYEKKIKELSSDKEKYFEAVNTLYETFNEMNHLVDEKIYKE